MRQQARHLLMEAVVTAYDDDRLRRPVRLTGTSSYVTNAGYSFTGRPQQYKLSTGGLYALLSFNYE